MQLWQILSRSRRLGFLLVGLLLLAPGTAGAAPGPSDVVRNLYAQLLDAMQRAASLGARGRYQKLEPVMLANL